NDPRTSPVSDQTSMPVGVPGRIFQAAQVEVSADHQSPGVRISSVRCLHNEIVIVSVTLDVMTDDGRPEPDADVSRTPIGPFSTR
ncbi:hypothetical protein GWI33_000315, partial [Rhynchophorus ferrugineus]